MLVEPQTQSHSLTLTNFQKLSHSPPNTGNPAWGLSPGEVISLSFHHKSGPGLRLWSAGHLLVWRLSDSGPVRSPTARVKSGVAGQACRARSSEDPKSPGKSPGAHFLSTAGPHQLPKVAFTRGNSLLLRVVSQSGNQMLRDK